MSLELKNKQDISEQIVNIFKEVGLNEMIANIKEEQ